MSKNNIKIKTIFICVIIFIILNLIFRNYKYILGNFNTKNSKYRIATTSYLQGSEIFLIENQLEANSESIVVKTKNSKLIVFDGGRVEDGEYLYNFIKKNGGEVDYWFLSHIHDDHIGALYEIMDKYKEINISNIVYNFADLYWYYDKIGDDAGIVSLFLDKLNEYILYKKDIWNIKIFDKLKKDEEFFSDTVKVRVLDDMYLLDDDSINNSSIVYKVYIDDKIMLCPGDLAYQGSELMAERIKENLKSDIVVMAHHGQNGGSEKFYEYVNPEICLWPTTAKYYYDDTGKYKTYVTKEWLSKLNVRLDVLSFEGTSVIK